MENGLINLVVLDFEIADGIVQQLLLRKKLRIELFVHLVFPLESSLNIGIDCQRYDKIDHYRNH